MNTTAHFTGKCTQDKVYGWSSIYNYCAATTRCNFFLLKLFIILNSANKADLKYLTSGNCSSLMMMVIDSLTDLHASMLDYKFFILSTCYLPSCQNIKL